MFYFMYYLLFFLLKINAQVMLTGEGLQDHSLSAYRQYIKWIWRTTIEGKSLYEKHSIGFEDQLQVLSFISFVYC